jgi:hypothetical protein
MGFRHVVFLVVLGSSSLAYADTAPVTCVAGQFADHIDGGKPVGDAKSIAEARKATYWVDMANTGEPTQVTLVWKFDGQEVQRQSLDVGKSPHWHTWGSRPLGTASTIDVQVLDASGTSLKEDSLSIR